jgi:hypothetical protein
MMYFRMTKRVEIFQHIKMISGWRDGKTYYPDLVIMHCVRVFNYHDIPSKDVQSSLKECLMWSINGVKLQSLKTFMWLDLSQRWQSTCLPQCLNIIPPKGPITGHLLAPLAWSPLTHVQMHRTLTSDISVGVFFQHIQLDPPLYLLPPSDLTISMSIPCRNILVQVQLFNFVQICYCLEE